MTTILILGATGSIGAELVRFSASCSVPSAQSARHGARRRPRRSASSASRRSCGDLDDARSLLLRPRSRASTGSGCSPPSARVPPENSMNATWAARQSEGRKHVVRASRDGSVPPTTRRPRNGRLHALSDRELMASGIPWTVIKPHFFMQNFLPQAPAMKAQGGLIAGLGDGQARHDRREGRGRVRRRLAQRAGAATSKRPTPSRGPASIGARGGGEGSVALERKVDYVLAPHEAARKVWSRWACPRGSRTASSSTERRTSGAGATSTTPDFFERGRAKRRQASTSSWQGDRLHEPRHHPIDAPTSNVSATRVRAPRRSTS